MSAGQLVSDVTSGAVQETSKPVGVPDWWRRQARAWFERPGAPTKKSVARVIECDPSAITVLLRPLADGGPSTSAVAKPLADYIGIPLPDEAVDEVGEMASVALRLKRLNPERLQFYADQLRDMLEGEEQRARQKTKPPDAGDHDTTDGAPKGAPGAGARAPGNRRTRR